MLVKYLWWTQSKNFKVCFKINASEFLVYYLLTSQELSLAQHVPTLCSYDVILLQAQSHIG